MIKIKKTIFKCKCHREKYTKIPYFILNNFLKICRKIIYTYILYTCNAIVRDLSCISNS